MLRIEHIQYNSQDRRVTSNQQFPAVLAALFAIFLATPLIAQTRLIRVDGIAGAAVPPSSGDGWDNRAYRYLQDAIDRARNIQPPPSPLSPVEIWVRGDSNGSDAPNPVYYPDQFDTDAGTGDRDASFALLANVSLLGGFKGVETSASERDPATVITILDGDLADDDGPPDSFTGYGENSFHVLTAGDADAAASAVLDGFTIRGGSANSPSDGPRREGGAIRIIGPAGGFTALGPLLRNCTFDSNLAANRGGAVHILDRRANIRECSFRNNQAGSGGAVLAPYAKILLSTFLNNHALGTESGGAVHSSSDALVFTCEFIGNTSAGRGGALHLLGSAKVIDCEFI
jgi:predicted outer membrane repeat protein